MTQATHKDVVVIGGGISGLVCAYRLKTLGIETLLIESSDRVGGVIRSDRIDGYLIERGPNSSQGTEELMALVEELGITGDLAEGDPKAPAFVYFDGRLHAVPAGPGAFLRSRLLTARGKLRLIGEPFIARRRSDEEESVASFARRRIGREAAERMVAPFVSGIYAGDAEQLSVQAAFPRLANLESSYGSLIRGAIAKAREARRAKKSARGVMDKAAPTRRRLISFSSGMEFLPRTLAARIGEDLLTGCSPCAIGHGGPERRFLVRFIRVGIAQEVACRHLVIAAPSHGTSSLVAEVSSDLSRLLSEIIYPPLAIVYLAYDLAAVSAPLDGFGFLVAPTERLNILGCVWNSSLFAGRAPEGKALLTVFIGGARKPELARQPDAELTALTHAELRDVLDIRGEPHAVGITRYDRSIPQYNLGHARRVREIEELLKRIPGLCLIGNYLHGVSTGDCVKEADRVAREIAASGSGGTAAR